MVQKLDFEIAPALLPAVRWHAVVYAGRDVALGENETPHVLPTFVMDLFEQASLEERAEAVIASVTDEALDAWLLSWPSWQVGLRQEAAAALQPEEDLELWDKPLSRKDLASLRNIYDAHVIKMVSTGALLSYRYAIDEWVRTGEITGKTFRDTEELKAEVFLARAEMSDDAVRAEMSEGHRRARGDERCGDAARDSDGDAAETVTRRVTLAVTHRAEVVPEEGQPKA
ncbi:unnamed protein product [Durusdinium trenchii]|uniref:Uncharacterized protein n=1 Tax=Durusdinium trenchii TaxID=1381693 RepID=A0ABP0RLZ4_9DINO